MLVRYNSSAPLQYISLSDNNNLVKAMEDLELLVINLSLEEMQTMNAKYSKEDKNVFANSYKAALR